MKKFFFFILFLFTWTATHESPLRPAPHQKASFLIAFKLIQSYEGGYVNTPNDFGEETYRGISRRFYKDWHGWSHIDEFKEKNGAPKWNYYFNDITDWHVTDFYVDIWVKEGFFDLENQAVANYLFDFRIHSPIGIRIIQQQLNEYGYQFELDNKMNPKIIETLNRVDSRNFLKSIKQKRINLYKQIVDRHPSQKGFLAHWLKRANT